MTRQRCLFAIAVPLLLAGCRTAVPDVPPSIRIDPDAPLGAAPVAMYGSSTLQRALENVTGRARIELAPGRYVLRPTAYTDPTCGNCENADTPAQATLGLRLSGERIELVGASPDSVIIETNAGYGILIEDCRGCVLRGITVTGGTRDPDGNATSAAVVVRRSTARLEQCRLRDNIGDSATVAGVVVGIAGIAGREEADVTVERCRIERNSWDGIALYRGARAEIRDNVIDGVDNASGARMTGGRGVGIGLTWDARAEIEGNLVRRYWKGIGVFVNARATVRHNIVEDILTWGIAYWGSGDGRPFAVIEENVIYETGACGAMIDRSANGDEAPGVFRRNVIVRTGQNERYDSGEPYCTQRPIARANVPAGFEIAGNLLLENRQPGGARREPELTRDAFMERLPSVIESLRDRSSLSESTFLRNFNR